LTHILIGYDTNNELLYAKEYIDKYNIQVQPKPTLKLSPDAIIPVVTI